MNIHQAVSSIPTCDFLTNTHMGYLTKDNWGEQDWHWLATDTSRDLRTVWTTGYDSETVLFELTAPLCEYSHLDVAWMLPQVVQL